MEEPSHFSPGSVLLWATVSRNMTYSPFSCPSFPCQKEQVISLLLLQPPSPHLHGTGKPLQQSQCCWLPEVQTWHSGSIPQSSVPQHLSPTPSESCLTQPHPGISCTGETSIPVTGFLHQKLGILQLLHMSGVAFFPPLELHREEWGLDATTNARNVKHTEWSLLSHSW